MDKQYILDEIRRTAAGNGGKPLGRERFAAETGIKPHQWMKFWSRFGDAQREAGFAANEKNQPYDQELLLRHVASTARQLRRFPTFADLRVSERDNPGTPSSKTILARFGSKARLVDQLAAFCHRHPDYSDVLQWCPAPGPQVESEVIAQVAHFNDGFVYLMKSGRFYKIGKTNHVGRRERELAIQLPERLRTIHEIKTDDPDGIEAYWHKRFASRRQRDTEWFDLTKEDVAAFRRRKFM